MVCDRPAFLPFAVMVLLSTAGCPGTARSPVPVVRPVVVVPTVAPRPWWEQGDAACPSLDGATPGGVATHPGRIRTIGYFDDGDACLAHRAHVFERATAEASDQVRAILLAEIPLCPGPARTTERAWVLFKAAAVAAASQRDCTRVEAYDATIRTLDRVLHDTVLVRQPDFASCLESTRLRDAAAAQRRDERARAWRADPRAACREDRRRAGVRVQSIQDSNERARILTRLPDCGAVALPSMPPDDDAARPGPIAEPPDQPPPLGDIHCEAGGVPHGPATRLTIDNQPAEAGSFDRGRREGAWTTWHTNGVVASHGRYRAGTRTGVWTTWDRSGRPTARGEWRGDTQVGMWVSWEGDGNADRAPDTFVDYGRDGDLFVHHGLGRRRLEGRFRRGEARESLPVCIVGFAYPGCRFLPLVEFGWEWRRSDRRFWSEVGLIVNLGEWQGVGLAAGGDASENQRTLGGRYRFWLLESIAAETGIARLYTPAGDGWRGHVSLVLADVVTGFAAVDTTSADGDRELTGIVGLKFGLAAVLGAGYVALTAISIAR
jgi:hypothetical protein